MWSRNFLTGTSDAASAEASGVRRDYLGPVICMLEGFRRYPRQNSYERDPVRFPPRTSWSCFLLRLSMSEGLPTGRTPTGARW